MGLENRAKRFGENAQSCSVFAWRVSGSSEERA